MRDLLVAGAAAAVVWAVGSGIARKRRPSCAYPYPRPRESGAPMARGAPCPVWPIGSSSNARASNLSYMDRSGKVHGAGGRIFFACRDDCDRHHVGVDIYANAGDPVIATEGGRVVGIQSFHKGTWAILVQTNSGPVVLYGEVARGSWNDFGISKGSIVRKGQPIARVGLMSSGSHMLHFEMYTKGSTRNKRWMAGQKNPGILDPTDYLLRARESLR